MHVCTYIDISHLADAFIQSDLQLVHLDFFFYIYIFSSSTGTFPQGK